MKINELKKADLEQCAKLLTLAYKGPPWNYQWTIRRADKYLHELFDSAGFIGFTAYEEDELVAAMFGHVKTWWINDLLMIDELFVSPHKQGSGYGQALMDAGREFSLKNNIGSITLITHKYMPAVSFYEKNKFLQAEQYVLMFNEF